MAALVVTIVIQIIIINLQISFINLFIMVLFDSIHVGQQVEVLWHSKVWTAKVLYTGQVDGIEGVWVGLELKKPGVSLCSCFSY